MLKIEKSVRMPEPGSREPMTGTLREIRSRERWQPIVPASQPGVRATDGTTYPLDPKPARDTSNHARDSRNQM